MASASIGGAPWVIQWARNQPAPPPSMTPIEDPVRSHALDNPWAGPIKGFASGVKVMGPLITDLMPPVSKAGTRAMASRMMCSTRSRSGGIKSAPNSGGHPSTDQTCASFSYGPKIKPSRSWRTYQLSSGSRMIGSSGKPCAMRSATAGTVSVTRYWWSTGTDGMFNPIM